jgi:hypothetical protein
MIENFIGIYDKVIDKDVCDNFIETFESLNKLNLTFGRNEDSLKKDDNSSFILHPEVLKIMNQPNLVFVIKSIWDCYNDYAKKFSVLSQAQNHSMNSIRMQKTEIGQGYHVWHFENSAKEQSDRLLTWILYLNDIEEGGETEFLYQHMRVKPKAGTLVMWPAGFTHTHRGNPPLSGTKYILTSWMEFTGNSLNG